MYEARTYRCWVDEGDLVSYPVTVKETDLLIRSSIDLSAEALAAVQQCRAALEHYIAGHPLFCYGLKPVAVEAGSHPLVRDMALAGSQAGVGPMAAVAGAIAELVGNELLKVADEVIVENGGDIFIKSRRRRLVGLYAGTSPFTGRIAFEIQPEQMPLGVCTSSGTVGHSLSLGLADTVVTFSQSTALADAAATAVANRVISEDDIPGAIEFAKSIPRLSGVVIVKGEKMGLWGQVKLVSGDE